MGLMSFAGAISGPPLRLLLQMEFWSNLWKLNFSRSWSCHQFKQPSELEDVRTTIMSLKDCSTPWEIIIRPLFIPSFSPVQIGSMSVFKEHAKVLWAHCHLNDKWYYKLIQCYAFLLPFVSWLLTTDYHIPMLQLMVSEQSFKLPKWESKVGHL